MFNYIKWRWRDLTSWTAAKWFQLFHGFDYRDCWNLDYHMAKWMAPRLRHLAANKMGAPCGYPLPDEQITFESPTDFDQWTSDINKAAKFFEDIVAEDDREDCPDNISEHINELKNRQHEVFTWMARYYRGLWD